MSADTRPSSRASRWLADARRHLPTVAFVLFVLVARGSLADHYIVPSGSMEPTLVPGDRVFVDKSHYGLRVPFTSIALRAGESPRAGEVVIFDSPEDGERLIKRVVAVGGDRVELRGGHLRVNGRALGGADEHVEQFDGRRAYLELRFGGGPDLGPLVVPPDSIVVLGDSRGNSRDSRYFGFVPIASVYARANGIFYRRGDGFTWRPL